MESAPPDHIEGELTVGCRGGLFAERKLTTASVPVWNSRAFAHGIPPVTRMGLFPCSVDFAVARADPLSSELVWVGVRSDCAREG